MRCIDCEHIATGEEPYKENTSVLFFCKRTGRSVSIIKYAFDKEETLYKKFLDCIDEQMQKYCGRIST